MPRLLIPTFQYRYPGAFAENRAMADFLSNSRITKGTAVRSFRLMCGSGNGALDPPL
jgi:hypothetical protein